MNYPQTYQQLGEVELRIDIVAAGRRQICAYRRSTAGAGCHEDAVLSADVERR